VKRGRGNLPYGILQGQRLGKKTYSAPVNSKARKQQGCSNAICIKCHKKVMELTLAYVTGVSSLKDL